MNTFKLLPCGRFIFYNSFPKPPDAVVSSPEKMGTVGGLPCVEGSHEPPGESDSGMGLSHAAISDKTSNVFPRAARGTKGITPHGRNLIRAGCYWLEENCGKKNLTFLTATLPDDALMVMTPSTWSEVVNRFLKGLRYHLESRGLCNQIVGCIEVQEGRLKRTNGVPPLHLHLLFQGKKSYQHWALDKEFYRDLWAQTCRTVWQIESEFVQSCRVESIRSSGASYMSKYLSKGGEVLSKCIPELLPKAWYTISSSLKEIIKANVIKGRSHLAQQLYEHIQNGELLSWARDVWSTDHGDGSQYLIAWVGHLRSREVYWKIRDELEYLAACSEEYPRTLYKFEF